MVSAGITLHWTVYGLEKEEPSRGDPKGWAAAAGAEWLVTCVRSLVDDDGQSCDEDVE